MADSNIENTKELIDSLSKLVETLDNFPLALDLIYIVSGAVICAFIYFITKMIIDFIKESRSDRILEKNTQIIGECKEAMNNVCTKLENL